jgi:regulator of replication initiation timing
MNVEALIKDNEMLREENKKLKEELTKTQEHLKKYTAPAKNKIYYENNKDAHIQRVKEYKEKTNYLYVPSLEQKKEWARNAYLNKKAKLKKIEEQS